MGPRPGYCGPIRSATMTRKWFPRRLTLRYMEEMMDKPTNIQSNQPEPQTQALSDYETLILVMRVLIGGALEGADELARRLKERQQEFNQNRTTSVTILTDDESELARLRFALIGLLFQASDQMVDRMASAQQTGRKAVGMADKVVGSILNSRLMRPLQRRGEKLKAEGEWLVDNLIKRGRVEEQAGRLLAREASVGVIDEVLAFMAEKPEIRELIQQQSVGMASEVVGQFRRRTADADKLIDRLAGAILRRSDQTAPAESTLRLEAPATSISQDQPKVNPL